MNAMYSKIIAVLGRYISVYESKSINFVRDYTAVDNSDTYRLITAHSITDKDEIYIENWKTGQYKMRITIERGKKRYNVFTCYVDEAYDFDEGTLEKIEVNTNDQNKETTDILSDTSGEDCGPGQDIHRTD